MKKIMFIVFVSFMFTGCASYIEHIKQSSVVNQPDTQVTDGQEMLHRVLPNEFTLNGHINPATGTYGGGLGGGF